MVVVKGSNFVHCQTSDWETIQASVLQGSILGPLLRPYILMT